jgi:hypothetical protein
MKLYYHKTDGGAEYYSTTHLPGSDEADLFGTVMRVDGGEIEIFTEQLKRQNIKLVLN